MGPPPRSPRGAPGEAERGAAMTYDFKIERLFDAPAELVFDTIVDPAFQAEIFKDQVEGWIIQRFRIVLGVGGPGIMEFGSGDVSGPNDVITQVFTELDRPRQIAYDVAMFMSEWGRTVRFTESITFEDQHGKTLVTVVLSGF